MSDIPDDLRYTKSHEWVRKDDDGNFTVGITSHAQHLLGDLVFVELPEPGAQLGGGDDCAVVESVKAASDVYCPITGEVAEVNEALADTPELVNKDPYGDGWIFKITPDDEASYEDLLSASVYAELVAEETH
jgi:glycine cleavage system H protein